MIGLRRVAGVLAGSDDGAGTSTDVGGGVAANRRLRAAFQAQAKSSKLNVYLPDLAFCTDNAAMIAAGGYFKLKTLGAKHPKLKALNVDANLPVASWGGAR